mgnify:CR=1 FL=1
MLQKSDHCYSYDRDRTYDFTLGERQVIKGVDMGLMNMCEGEKRRLTVPSILAYGEDGYGKQTFSECSIFRCQQCLRDYLDHHRWIAVSEVIPACLDMCDSLSAAHDR